MLNHAPSSHHNKQEPVHVLYILCSCRTRTMQSLSHTESRPWPGLWDHREGHLPGNLSCSDYTMCLACLSAILPFCSVKYKRHSGKVLMEVRSLAYQFTTFEFTEPGAGILLYPGREPSLGVRIKRGGGTGGGKNSSVKERRGYHKHNTMFFFSPFCSSRWSSEESPRPEMVLFSKMNQSKGWAEKRFSNQTWQRTAAEKCMNRLYIHYKRTDKPQPVFSVRVVQL